MRQSSSAYVNVMQVWRRVVDTWTISELSQEYAVTLRTLRHYEELGLLAPERRGTTRVYHQRDRTRLELILRGKRLGFSLDEIRVIVNMYDEPPGARGQLEFLIEQCDVRRAQLEQQRRDIDETLAELARVKTRCEVELDHLAASSS
jgi:DNA-binding transcriptional MerR regulator